MADKSRYKNKFNIQHIGPTGSNRKREIGSGDKLFDHDRAMFGTLLGLGIGGLGGTMYAGKQAQNERTAREHGRHWTPRIKRESDEEVLRNTGGWIQDAIKKPGALRKSLGVKKGQTIPKKKLQAAVKKGGTTGKRARLAVTLGKMRKKT